MSTPCGDRPDCMIPAHHAVEDMTDPPFVPHLDDPAAESGPRPVRQPFSLVSVEDLKHLFDLAVDTPLVCSGSFDTDDVNLLRRIAVLLGVDPNSITPDEFISQYPHPHKPRLVNPNPWPVQEYVGLDGQVYSTDGPDRRFRQRRETMEEVVARNVEEASDPACQAGSYGRRCGKPADDPIHTSTGDPT